MEVAKNAVDDALEKGERIMVPILLQTSAAGE